MCTYVWMEMRYAHTHTHIYIYIYIYIHIYIYIYMYISALVPQAAGRGERSAFFFFYRIAFRRLSFDAVPLAAATCCDCGPLAAAT